MTSDPPKRGGKRGPTLRTGELLTLLFCVILQCWYVVVTASSASGSVTPDPPKRGRKRGPTLRTGELLTLLFCV